MNDDVSVLQLVVIPRRPGDRWPLTGRYVELVTVGVLGPTATVVARRLGFLVEAHPGGTTLSPAELAATLAIPPAKVVTALRRLHLHGLVVFAPDQGLLGVSGFAPSVGPEQLARLSSASQREHQRLVAEAAEAGERRPESPPEASPRAAVGRPWAVSRPAVGRSL